MRLLFISDIHGVPSTLEAALDAAQPLGYDKIVLLGDLLYHGPRNGVPNFYNPVKVAKILNGLKDKIVAVRGNCDAEVDQMVLPFPILDEKKELTVDGRKVILVHGHHEIDYTGYDVVMSGHTHIPVLEKRGATLFLNPGSTTITK